MSGGEALTPLQRAQAGVEPVVFLTLLRPLPMTTAAESAEPPPDSAKGASNPVVAFLGGGKRRRLPKSVLRQARRILDKAAEEYKAGSGRVKRRGGGDEL